MNLSLSGRLSIVCGSTSGIGRACAQLLAERGASVVLAARDEEKLISTVNSLDGDGHSYICADFNEPDNLRSKTIDHINKTGNNFLIGKTPHNNQLGFPDMSDVYKNIKGKVFVSYGRDFKRAKKRWFRSMYKKRI